MSQPTQIYYRVRKSPAEGCFGLLVSGLGLTKLGAQGLASRSGFLDTVDQTQTGESSINTPEQSKASSDPSLPAVLAVDGTRKICGVNTAVSLLLGASAPTLLRQPYDLLPPGLKQLFDDTFRTNSSIVEQALALEAGGEVFCACTTLCVASDGTAAGAVAVIDRSGTVQDLGGNMQRLHRLASIGTLSASMAHEIKNAFVAVKTMVDDLVQRNRDLELASIAARELRRIDSILSQILRFSGPGKPTFARVSLHRVLEHCLRLIQPQLETKHVHLRRSFSARPDSFTGDDYQLEQALLNLLLNSIAALSQGGELSISTETVALKPAGAHARPAQPAIRVTISDTGVGIAPENLGRLFEPFFTTKPEGTGLGLAITRRIVTEHHGTIDVESQVGSGTTFRICLPCEQLSSPAAQ